ncbi:NeuD/PglB/VioB family sugar acetyltransferase [Haloimpatiens lingqiaonensis]|uniref:NeuD/PglB/VioB family sugar acetyltransferase n=1 Tax=Haloimpatiens lingqiaonensis TaxID=1380675 RepID=UPI0014855709|nr:NeuD/PglB/VioB family sugar acetyltransferase [Haloimpatiens lingqiaonensis]
MCRLLILGAGGHGRVVAEAAELEGKWEEIAFLDDREDIKSIYNFPIVGKMKDYSNLLDEYKYAFVAIGNNPKRLELIDNLKGEGFNIPNIIHPRAIVSKYSKLDLGTVVLAGAIVNTGASIGRGCIININATVDHDSEIGSGVHIGSGAVVRSMAKVGKLSTIGAAACVKSATVLKDKFILQEGSVI